MDIVQCMELCAAIAGLEDFVCEWVDSTVSAYVVNGDFVSAPTEMKAAVEVSEFDSFYHNIKFTYRSQELSLL